MSEGLSEGVWEAERVEEEVPVSELVCVALEEAVAVCEGVCDGVAEPLAVPLRVCVSLPDEVVVFV